MSEVPTSEATPRTAFLFPGQGAQSLGMAKDVCAEYPSARALFDQAADILGYDLYDLCVNGPEDKLNSTEISQPAIFVASLAGLKKLEADQPDVVANCETTAGLSLGEYTALVFAGALSFEDGLRVVKRRGEAMQTASDATPSGMASVMLAELSQVEAWCQEASSAGYIRVANHLCPGNIVVSGEKSACEKMKEVVESAEGRIRPLTVAGAFHTQLMKPADDELGKALEEASVQTPRIPVWSNVDAQPHTDPAEIRELLVRQVIEPVLMEPLLRGLLEAGITRFYEIGPGRVLAGLMKRIDRKTDFENVTV